VVVWPKGERGFWMRPKEGYSERNVKQIYPFFTTLLLTTCSLSKTTCM
jgi:hypothetical protein